MGRDEGILTVDAAHDIPAAVDVHVARQIGGLIGRPMDPHPKAYRTSRSGDHPIRGPDRRVGRRRRPATRDLREPRTEGGGTVGNEDLPRVGRAHRVNVRANLRVDCSEVSHPRLQVATAPTSEVSPDTLALPVGEDPNVQRQHRRPGTRRRTESGIHVQSEDSQARAGCMSCHASHQNTVTGAAIAVAERANDADRV